MKITVRPKHLYIGRNKHPGSAYEFGSNKGHFSKSLGFNYTGGFITQIYQEEVEPITNTKIPEGSLYRIVKIEMEKIR